MVLRIHGKDESVVRFRQGAPFKKHRFDTRYQAFLYLNKGMNPDFGMLEESF